jgi:hypothetical protein
MTREEPQDIKVFNLNLSNEQLDRFWSKVDRKGPGECWRWNASIFKRNGYGQFGARDMEGRRSMRLAHRVSYFIAYGPFEHTPRVTEICHTCDNKLCVNPNHLELATHAKNMRDSWDRGLNSPAYIRGEKCGKSKLNNHQVISIREDRRTHRVIAKEYGISSSQVCKIKKREQWGWLK